MVPHLITALKGPINELEARILESMPATERWFRLEWMEHTPTFYASVDLRNAGFKLAPVDTNLFPGGFNHLTPQMLAGRCGARASTSAPTRRWPSASPSCWAWTPG
jgi:glutamate--cysteine ligase